MLVKVLLYYPSAVHEAADKWEDDIYYVRERKKNSISTSINFNFVCIE